MSDKTLRNRKLLVSVFGPQEAREGVLGGGRIIDSEDPRSALGNITPRQIMAISDAVLNYQRDLELQLSTNIGEDQLLFNRTEDGLAVEKSPFEIAGKSAQAAIGVACAMGTRVHPCNLVKVGVDGMQVDLLRGVLEEVVLTLRRTEQFSHSNVMSVLFAQNITLWNERKSLDPVRAELISSRQYYPAKSGDPDTFDLKDYAVSNLRDQSNNPLFTRKEDVTLPSLKEKGALPPNATDSVIRLNELFAHKQYFPNVKVGDSTNEDVMRAMIDATADAGANAIMLDTSILCKASLICSVDTASQGLYDLNKFYVRNGITNRGILSLDQIKFFVDYCHFRGVEANLAGSLQSFQAQQLWLAVPDLDQLSTRSSASGVRQAPGQAGSGLNTRSQRVIKRHLVRGLAAPEHNGVLNLPAAFKDNAEAVKMIGEMRKTLQEQRRAQMLPDLESYWVDDFGNPTAIS